MKKKTYQFISYLVWGFFLLLMTVNLYGFNLLPNWLGYLMFFLAFRLYAKESMKPIQTLSLVLLVFSFAGWVMGLLHLDHSFAVLEILEIVIDVANIYLLYRIMDEVIEIAAENGSTQTERLKICHHVNVATEVILVISDIIMLFKGNFVEFLVPLCLAAGVIASMINAKAMSFLEGELYSKYGMN